ncbi:MAG: hypothetical protein HYY68_04380 [Thaumarchaeota archaeon]|nr:hypothetical protein [Nitrososphaerota archaeon]MBI3022949.1 hypothetical protein [Nitrososphaerota archaeon]MBI3116236.1 hypothetical protein [Nitrososphaerota archaeon]
MRRRKEDDWYEDAVREIDEQRKDPEKWKKYVASRASVVLGNWRRGRTKKSRKFAKSFRS